MATESATELASKTTLETMRETQRGRLKKQVILDLADQCALQSAITFMESKEMELHSKGLFALESIVRTDRMAIQKVLARIILAEMIEEN